MAKILLIDDDKMILDMSKTILEKVGLHSVVTANNQKEAELIFDAQPDIDLVLTDKSLIGRNGKEGIALTGYFKSKRPNIPVIMRTADVNEVDRLAFQKAGGNLFLVKNIDPKTLLKHITTLLNQQESKIKL